MLNQIKIAYCYTP